MSCYRGQKSKLFLLWPFSSSAVFIGNRPVLPWQSGFFYRSKVVAAEGDAIEGQTKHLSVRSMVLPVLEYCFMLYVPQAVTGIAADSRACPQKNCFRVLENDNRRTLFLNVSFFPTSSLSAPSGSQSRFIRPLPSGGIPPPRMTLAVKEKVFGGPRLQAACLRLVLS